MTTKRRVHCVCVIQFIFTHVFSFCFAVPPKLAPFANSDEPLHLGDYFQLTCAVVHGDFPYNITWYFNDEPITYIDGVSVLMHGKRSSSLNIDSVSALHSGNFSCVGSNIAGRASMATTLSIRGSCTHSHTIFVVAKFYILKHASFVLIPESYHFSSHCFVFISFIYVFV